MDTLTTPRLTVEKRSLAGETPHHYFIPASYRAFRLLHIGFVVLPIVVGVDKFFNLLANWTMYLSPLVTNITNLTPETFMKIVGIVEIVAGILVAVSPRLGGFLVAAWLWGIIINLVSIPRYFDVALRDLGLSFGALALSWLSVEFGHYKRHSSEEMARWKGKPVAPR